jgi:hypothetical protein
MYKVRRQVEDYLSLVYNRQSGVIIMGVAKLVLIACLLVSGSMPTSTAQAAFIQRFDWSRTDSASDLWLDVSLGQPLVSWFNRTARPNDIARVEQAREINLLDEVTVGRKLVVFKSFAEAERLLPRIADRIDIIGYNLEQGPMYAPDEQADPVASVKRMHELAQQYQLTLAFGPDHDFAVSYGPLVAPYVDIFVLQVQRVQTEPATVYDFALPLIKELRQANPDLQVSVQVRTEGNVVAIADLIDSIKDSLDGVSILTSPETVDVAEALVTELRTRESATSGSTAIQATLAAQTEPGAKPVSGQETSQPWPKGIIGILMVGAAAGALAGGVAGALTCAARSRSARK